MTISRAQMKSPIKMTNMENISRKQTVKYKIFRCQIVMIYGYHQHLPAIWIIVLFTHQVLSNINTLLPSESFAIHFYGAYALWLS